MMLFILAAFYATMVAAGYAVEMIFGATGLVPDYTTILNIVFLVIAAVLVWRFSQPTAGRCSR